jgi:hypothetical protein
LAGYSTRLINGLFNNMRRGAWGVGYAAYDTRQTAHGTGHRAHGTRRSTHGAGQKAKGYEGTTARRHDGAEVRQ